MSWHFSQALAEAYSQANCSDGEPFAQWKSTPFAPDDSCSDKMKGTCHHSPFGTMFVPSTDESGRELLMWFRAGFRARIFQSAETEMESQEQDPASGNKWRGSFARYDPASLSWKTHQYSLLGGLIPYSETYPRWGMMQNGECFQLAPLVRHIHGKGCSLWPTPTAREKRTLAGGRDRKRSEKSGKSLCRTIGEALGFPAKTYIKPYIIEKMMCWPVGWTGVNLLETAKFRQWLNLHGKH